MAGCNCGPLKKLSNHLKMKHANLSPAMHREALKCAKVVQRPGKDGRVGVLPLKGQKSLLEYGRQKVTPLPDEERDISGRGTRNFPAFTLGKGGEIDMFTAWLRGVDGGMRQDRESIQVSLLIQALTLTPNHQSIQITVDVSKFLRYTSNVFNWSNLLKLKEMREYLDRCHSAKIGPDGLVTKCDRLITALRYYKMELVDNTDGSTRSEIDHAIDRVDAWRKSYRKLKKETRTASTARLLEDKSDEGRTDREITMLLESKDIWGTLLTCAPWLRRVSR